MDASKKEYNELRVNFNQQEQALQTQKNKDELVYTTTAGGANFRAQGQIRDNLLDQEDKLED